MISKLKASGDEGGFKMRYILYAVGALLLLLTGCYWTGALNGAAGGSECNATNFRTVKLLDKNGKLEMEMYVYGGRDEISDLVATTVKAPDSHFHNFYNDFLCNTTAKNGKKRCSGLAIDLGAHLGSHTLYLAKAGFQVHAFEPFRPSAELLQCSVKANKFDVLVIPEGMSNETTNECMIFPLSSQSQRVMFVPKGVGYCADTNQSVPVVSLDHYWNAALDRKNISFVRVDVAGHEALVLEGAKQLLATAPPPYILMKYSPTLLSMKSVQRDEFMKRIFSAKYRMYDCVQKVEIKSDYRGDAVLDEYKDNGLSTDLLLVHSTLFSGDLPDFGCST